MHDNMHLNADLIFTCNAIKSATNERDRGLPLLAAKGMFDAHMVVIEDVRKAYSEQRFIGMNFLNGRLMVVVFCTPDPQTVHIISFRKANHREQKKFDTQTFARASHH